MFQTQECLRVSCRMQRPKLDKHFPAIFWSDLDILCTIIMPCTKPIAFKGTEHYTEITVMIHLTILVSQLQSIVS
jgi:hypothetical protein